MLRLLVPFLALGASIAFGPAQAQDPPPEFQAECAAKLLPTKIEVQVSPLAFTTESSLSVRDLTAKQRANNATWTLGLTVVDRKTSYSYGAERLVRSDGWACIRPRFEVRIQVSPQRVYVAKEFPRGTCAFNEILNHELRHVKANQSQAVDAARRFQAEMHEAFGQTIYYGEQSSLTAQLDRVMTDGWIARMRDQLSLGDQAHAAIDTAEEYARMGTVCGGEIHQTLVKGGVR